MPNLSPALTMLPEWATQEAVILAWPHEDTDWAPWLDETRLTYIELIKAINANACVVLLLCREKDLGLIKSLVPYQSQVLLLPCDYNDTWVRDYAFITCESANGNQGVDFGFNGWGNKFDASKDNLINQTVLSPLCRRALVTVPVILEGGALEIDQNQHLLSTASCLLNPERNKEMTLAAYHNLFGNTLGASSSSIFTQGLLEGDDTDGHIDTLVRFTPLHSVVMQSAFNRPQDSHFMPLQMLKEELSQALPSHRIYELPLPHIENKEQQRLPASYANFLICNNSVIMPIYQQAEDQQAIEVMTQAFPNHRIITIDCLPLVQQFGSLHCITMQIPEHTLLPEILLRAQTGVTTL